MDRDTLMEKGKCYIDRLTSEYYGLEGKFYRVFWVSPCVRLNQEGGWFVSEITVEELLEALPSL